jgi:hypothetical protein
VPRHEYKVALKCQVDQLAGLSRGAGERLLDEDVFARLERARGELEVCRDRGGNRDRIDGGVVQYSVVRRRHPARGVAPPDRLERLGAAVANVRDLGLRQLVQVANEVRAPVAEPDHRNPDRHRERER